MSGALLATAGTVLGGLAVVMLLPLPLLVLRVGRGTVTLVAGAALCAAAFAVGHLAAWLVGTAVGGFFGRHGPIWAGWLPVHGPDLSIFALMLGLGIAMTVIVVRGQTDR